MNHYDMAPFNPADMAGNGLPVQYPWPPAHSPYPYEVNSPLQLFISIRDPWNPPLGFQHPFQMGMFNRQQPNNQLHHNAPVNHESPESRAARLTRERLEVEKNLEIERIAKVAQYLAEKPVADMVEQLLAYNLSVSIEGQAVANPEWTEAHDFLRKMFLGEVGELLKHVPACLAPYDRSNAIIDAAYISRLMKHGRELTSDDAWKSSLITARIRLWDKEGLSVNYSEI